MNGVAAEDARERDALFRATAVHRQVTPQVAEKDFWVCWTLSRLFPVSKAEPDFLFKGGTSLSKVYGAIARFSEDIDLSMSPALIGESPEQAHRLSNTARRKLFERMIAAARAHLHGELLPTLAADFERVLGASRRRCSWSLAVDPENADAITFAYPVAVTSAPGYVRQRILLEFGVRSEMSPWGEHTVTPYAADTAPDAFRNPSVSVPTLAAERTFWEKATLLHAAYHQSPTRPVTRLSRHYADLAALAAHASGAAALADLELLGRVVRHKSVFYPAQGARYDLAVPGTLRLAPHPELRDRLAVDYREMREMFFGDAEVRPFAQIVADLEALETSINR